MGYLGLSSPQTAEQAKANIGMLEHFASLTAESARQARQLEADSEQTKTKEEGQNARTGYIQAKEGERSKATIDAENQREAAKMGMGRIKDLSDIANKYRDPKEYSPDTVQSAQGQIQGLAQTGDQIISALASGGAVPPVNTPAPFTPEMSDQAADNQKLTNTHLASEVSESIAKANYYSNLAKNGGHGKPPPTPQDRLDTLRTTASGLKAYNDRIGQLTDAFKPDENSQSPFYMYNNGKVLSSMDGKPLLSPQGIAAEKELAEAIAARSKLQLNLGTAFGSVLGDVESGTYGDGPKQAYGQLVTGDNPILGQGASAAYDPARIPAVIGALHSWRTNQNNPNVQGIAKLHDLLGGDLLYDPSFGTQQTTTTTTKHLTGPNAGQTDPPVVTQSPNPWAVTPQGGQQ